MGRLGKEFARAKGYQLNKQGKEGVLNLAEVKGEDRVALVWGVWIKTRNLDGLTCPFFKFVEEFEETEAAMGKHADDAQAEEKQKDNKRAVKDSEIARAEWRKKLDETTDIDAFIAKHPCPPYLVEINGKLETLASDGPELIENARRRLANPILTAKQKQEMAEAAF